MDAVVEERWRERRRERILRAASRVFSRLSFDAASMDEIAHEAGVGKPTVYRYFDGKDALFSAVFVQALDELEDRLDEVLASGGNASAQIEGLVTAIVPLFRDHLVPLGLLDEHAAVAGQSKRRIFRERRERLGGYLARAVEAGVRRGELRPADPGVAAQLMLGMIWSATASSRADDAEIVAQVTAMALHGLADPAAGCAKAGAESSQGRNGLWGPDGAEHRASRPAERIDHR